MTRIDEIKKRLEDATPGPWEYSIANQGSIFGDLLTDHNGDNPYIGNVHGIGLDRREGVPNGQLIVNAPTDIAYLLAELEKLDAELRQTNADLYFMEVGRDANLTNVKRFEAKLAKRERQVAVYEEGLKSYARLQGICGPALEALTKGRAIMEGE